MDKIYCINCKKLFDDRMETRRRQGVISFGQFMYNQQRIMWDEPIKFTGNKRIFIVNCPHCNSMNTVNATETMEQLKLIEQRDAKGKFTKGHKTRLNLSRKIRNEIKTIMKYFKYNEQHS